MQEGENGRKRFFSSFYNAISLAGAYLATLSFGLILLLILVEWVSERQTPYLGILTYIILPVFLIGGLLLIPFGMWRQHRREVLGKKIRRLPRVDLNIPSHRRSVVVFVSATVVLIFFTGIGTYRAYEFTDSVTFCGQVCHEVMHPEFTTYKTSPHARVKCVECHVGPGATWYVKSKLSGAYQVYSVLFNQYEKPIPTPIENLRPARETCESCHWPEKFYGNKETTRIHYLPDEQNSRWEYSLLVKIGGSSFIKTYSEGIHWHIDNQIEYVATDAKYQEIPWVRVTYRDSSTRIFTLEGRDSDGAPPPEGVLRRMDCIDCHNRPSHIFLPPHMALNRSLEANRISADLPLIKSIAVEAIETAEKEETTEAALQVIAAHMQRAYQDDAPEIWETRQGDVLAAIAEVQRVFQMNFFPEMKTNWRSHTNNIGHFLTPGCYRCHDGQHIAADGRMISNDCNICHLIVKQKGGDGFAEQSLDGLVFKHPEDIDEEWKETGCYECHGAG